MTLFYKLTTDTANTLIESKLPRSSWELWTWLTTLNPFGNQIVPLSWERAHEAIGITKTTFYRALKRLVDSGLLISQKIANFCVSFKNGTQDPEAEIESQKSSSEFQNCDPSLYIDLEFDQILSEGESEKIQDSDPGQKAEGPTDRDVIDGELTDHSTLLTTAMDSDGEKFSAAGRTKKRTKENKKNFDWLPEGPWNLGGKLDPHFRDWLAKDWISRYGGTIHQKRADVLAHFKKDPANLPIRWEQYQGEFLHRAQNAQILLSHGAQVKSETQDLITTHQRALTAEFPPEMNPVAVEPSPESPTIPQLPTSPDPEPLVKTEISPVPNSEAKPLVKDETTPSSANEDEFTELPDGKRLKVFRAPQKPIVTPEEAAENRKMIAEFLRAFAGSSSRNQPKPPAPPSELEILNQWLHDPAFREEAIAQAHRSESFKYCPDLDEIIEAEEF